MLSAPGLRIELCTALSRKIRRVQLITPGSFCRYSIVDLGLVGIGCSRSQPARPRTVRCGCCGRSGDARQTLDRFDARIDYLETLIGDNQGKSLGLNHAGYLRNQRGIAELKWCRAMLANGGVEPIEWAPKLEPTPLSEHGTLS